MREIKLACEILVSFIIYWVGVQILEFQPVKETENSFVSFPWSFVATQL